MCVAIIIWWRNKDVYIEFFFLSILRGITLVCRSFVSRNVTYSNLYKPRSEIQPETIILLTGLFFSGTPDTEHRMNIVVHLSSTALEGNYYARHVVYVAAEQTSYACLRIRCMYLQRCPHVVDVTSCAPAAMHVVTSYINISPTPKMLLIRFSFFRAVVYKKIKYMFGLFMKYFKSSNLDGIIHEHVFAQRTSVVVYTFFDRYLKVYSSGSATSSGHRFEA